MSESIIRDIKIENPSSIDEFIGAEQVGESTYLLLENPVFSCHVNFGTIIKVEPNESGELVMTGIEKESVYKTRRFLLSTFAKDSDFVKSIGDPIIAAGGTWEVAMGGIAFIHLPKQSNFDLDRFFKENEINITEFKEDLRIT